MGNGKKPVAQTYFEVTDIKHNRVKTSLDYSDNVFTYLKNAYTADKMRPISINDFGQLINEYSNAKGGKYNDRCLLKGLYKNGFNGADCIKGVPYLFFDIDVKDSDKKKENTHLLSVEKNQSIFNELQKIAVICWRSNSGAGMAGVLYVPQLAQYYENEKQNHLAAGKAVTSHISQYLESVTGIGKVEFDQAQSKFRQVRFLAEQSEKRTINTQPLEFNYTSETKVKEYAPGVTVYRPSDNRQPFGEVTGQFDSDNDILGLMLQYGFSEVSQSGNKIRVKYQFSESSTTGAIDQTQNVYFNYSETLGGKTSFTPSRIVCKFKFNDNWGDFKRYLYDLGYKEKQRAEDEIKDVSKALKRELNKNPDEVTAKENIFKICYDLQTLSKEKKQRFIKETCTRAELKKYFVAYLNLNDYKISFDKRLTIKKYVSDVLPDVLKYTDQHGKVILRAETGKGKTTAFIRDLHKHRPAARILILEPLTIIVNQAEKEYNEKAIFLTGSSPKDAHKEAQNKNMVMATYEQGIKQLATSIFDYVIIDEVHQLLTANSFKRDVIAKLTPYFYQSKIIGLTGTPTAIFKQIGFKLIDADVKQPQKTKVEVRFLNYKPYSIALSHLRNAKGKTLLRLNDIKALKALEKQLIASKIYKRNEILLLYSAKQVKDSKDFKTLAHDRRFSENTKLILTTSLIDEGLSIDQNGFTDVVFIESSYHPRPEPVKQFFARFRNEDPNRNSYLYLRKTKNQSPGRVNPFWIYKNNFKAFETEAEAMGDNDVISTYDAIFSNDPYFYEDNTVNPFFLGYSVTSVLFKSFNTDQFLNYLETNYNLNFTNNPIFDYDPGKVSFENSYRKKIKKQIARAWYYYKDEVLQTLALHTQSTTVRSDLKVKQMRITPEVESLVIDNIKEVEKLYKRSQSLKNMGVSDPDKILIEYDTFLNEVSLTSQKKYKDEVTIIKLDQMIFKPKNQADKKASERVTKFANWCKTKENFTHAQMFTQLRKLGVYKNSDYTENMLFRVLAWFNLEAKKDTNTKLILISEKINR